MAYSERAFQADDAVGRLKEPETFLVERVGRMVGRDHVHRAVGDRRDRGLPILFAPQRRVHLRERAILEERLVVEREIVRGGLAGDRQAFRLRAADRVETDRRAHMLEVHVHAGFAHQVDVALHNRQFGVLRNAGHTECARHRPLVDGAGVMVFAVFDQIQAGVFDVLEHGAQHRRRNGGPVVAHRGDRVGDLRGVLLTVMAGHIPRPVRRIARHLARTILRGAYTQLIAHRQRHIVDLLIVLQIVDDIAAACVEDLLGARLTLMHALSVHRRHGVRHDEHVRVAAGRRGRTPGDHRLLVRLARVAEVHMRVLKTRRHGERGRVQGHVTGLVGHDQVDALARVPYTDVGEGDCHQNSASSSQ